MDRVPNEGGGLKPGRIFRRIKRARSEGGILHTMLLISQKLLSGVVEFGSLAFYCCETAEVEDFWNAGLRFRDATRGDIPSLLNIYGFSRAPSLFEERFQRGDHCILALDHRGQAVNARWCIRQRACVIPELGMEMRLGKSEAYIYDVHTREDVRGMGIESAARRHCAARLAAAGVKKYYLYVRGDSPVARKAVSDYERLIDRVWYLRFLKGRTAVFGGGAINLAPMASASNCVQMPELDEKFEPVI